MNVLSLFAGIGGIDLGLQRAGMTVVGQVEIDPYCRAVLAHHWPEVPRHDDVRTCIDWWRSEPRPTVHLVAGGFPCQPFSTAGKRSGIADDRWGWPWMFDVVRAVRPHYVLVENSAALIADADAFSTILAGLAQVGFDAEWSVLSACAMGAPHTRERLFLVAHPDRGNGTSWLGTRPGWPLPGIGGAAGAWADPLDGFVAADGYGRRVADGVSAGLEPARITALGNAVVPQVVEHIGRLILDAGRVSV